MSLRLRILNLLLGVLGRPALARASDPAVERRKLEIGAQFFHRPPYLCFLDGDLPRVTCKPRRSSHAVLYFHGGAYMTGGPRTHLSITGRLARLTGLPVFPVRYPLAPEHPAPAAFMAALAAHAALARLYPPQNILIGGDSAGGGLALALVSHLCQTGQTPGGAFAFSPWTDLALTGASLTENTRTELILPPERLVEAAEKVRGALAVEDPRISPLYADFPNCPPVLIQVGSGEILLDDSRRMAARINARLSEWPDCPHVWQIFDGYLPEARAALKETAAFLRHLAARTVR
jgi:monoterpene epsilon-lactone hydrolase